MSCPAAPQATPGGPPPMSEVHADVVTALRTYYRSMEHYMDSAGVREHMHRSDLDALAAIMEAARQGHALTARDISRETRLSTSATTSLLDRLEKAGHVERHPHPSDRRSTIIRSTELSQQVGRQLFGRIGRTTSAVMRKYSDEELTLIAQFLQEVSAAATEE